MRHGMRVGVWGAAAAAVGIGLTLPGLPARGQKTGAVPVRVEQTAEGYRLLRDGQPYLIRGVGGTGSLDKLKAAGANSIRTWGVDNLDPLLAEAQRLGLTVTVGLWLGHERHGFNYNNADQIAEQQEKIRQAILKYKDHPAVLMWGLGNEMEGYEKGDNAAIWSAINNLAALAKRLDPHHPTMTVVAEIGGDRVKNIHRLCPEIDVVGINSYGGAPSIPQRYREAGGTRPFVLTEFGPAGSWEVQKKPWGAPLEPTSTEKAASYRTTYEKAVRAQPLSLGSYAFVWGHKQEATATWFGLLLPDGSRLGGVDALSEQWTGKAPANRCPAIATLSVVGAEEVDPGATIRAALQVADPEGDPLKVEWVLQPEASHLGVGGDAEAVLPTLPEAILKGDLQGAEVRAPKEPGAYRLFAYIRDGQGGAAVGNLPLRVRGEVKAPPGLTARLPLVVFGDGGGEKPPYVPTGWMGNTRAIFVDENNPTRPHTGKACLRCEYRANADWGGVVWQHPAGDWGDRPGGWKLEGARRLVFWARGEKGGEVVSFQYGLLGRDKKFADTANGKLDTVKLTPEWKEYVLDVSGKDLSRIKTAFAWVVAGQGAPVTFYLDDIRYE